MAQRRVLPYGSWPSPISIEMAVASSLSLREPRLDGEDVCWLEGRPNEAGRQVIVRWNERQSRSDVTPAGFNARTMAHEYGGGAYAVHESVFFFSNLGDGRVYRQRAGGDDLQPLTPEGPLRFADFVVDPLRPRLLAVREDHSCVEQATGTQREDGRRPEPDNCLVAISLPAQVEEPEVTVLASGYDFYSTPRPSPDGQHLAWLCWRHPNMPWDGTELWLADVAADGSLSRERKLAGSPEESIVQPEWTPDGSMVFASDQSGWWNLYRLSADQLVGPAARAAPQPLAPMEAEFASAQWVFGMSWYGIGADGSIVGIVHREGRDELWLVPAGGGPAERIDVPDTVLHSLRVGGENVVYVGASETQEPAIVLLDLRAGERRLLRKSSAVEIGRAYISSPRPISFPTSGGQTARALYYPPTNPDAEGPEDERPPLVVMSHGGPTSNAWGALDLAKQVFTSRGFAVVDVNYGGSTGYGRDYMRRLDGLWGIVDVEDCINAARHLARQGEVDEERMAIRGGSAGGYTTLCALVFHDVFKAGASYFGVGDLEALVRDTHKFESRYLDRLVAPYPEGVEIYRQRSPIHALERLACAVIVFQGRDDRVVPVAQAEALVTVLRDRGLPHVYICFDGEGHGFRQAENIKRSLESELSFYAQIFGFELADEVEPVVIS